ncbi:MAG: 4Fe-4S double cluster binding domain-containing protein, partial [Desulfobacterales bacterium]
KVNPPGYLITTDCTTCGLCIEACPVEVISEGEIYRIDGSHCLSTAAVQKFVRKMPSRPLKEYIGQKKINSG